MMHFRHLGCQLAFLCLFSLNLLRPTSGEPLPYSMSFYTEFWVGPDGPWNTLDVDVDWPYQSLSLLPSLTETSVIVNATICGTQNANCPVPTPAMWEFSVAQNYSYSSNSDSFSASTWNANVGNYTSQVLGLKGDGRYITQRFTLNNNGGNPYLDGMSTVADNFTITFPGNIEYTMDVGMFSLYGKQDNFTYQTMLDKPMVRNLTLPNAYLNGVIPSISYGLHIGSAAQNISGSLYLGGYDNSRVLTDPISAAGGDYVYLADVSLGVAAGGYSYLNTSKSSITGLLKPSSDTSLPLSTQPDPGVPYMYLPGKTCDAIASHLPVHFSPDLNLYLWNTSAIEYESIVSSPHFLSFEFYASGSSGATTAIDIPFVLLNLTLTPPLVSSDAQYFPCYPYTPDPTTPPSVILGRAFLQGAFLAQNWQEGYLWLAQAPGPNHQANSVKTLETTATTLAPMFNGPLWNETWSAALHPLNSSINSTYSSQPSNTSPSTQLSTGAKAGIGVGCAIGGILLLGGLVAGLRSRKGIRAETAAEPYSLDGSHVGPVGRMEQHEHEQHRQQQQQWPIMYEAADGRIEELPAAAKSDGPKVYSRSEYRFPPLYKDPADGNIHEMAGDERNGEM